VTTVRRYRGGVRLDRLEQKRAQAWGIAEVSVADHLPTIVNAGRRVNPGPAVLVVVDRIVQICHRARFPSPEGTALEERNVRTVSGVERRGRSGPSSRKARLEVAFEGYIAYVTPATAQEIA
jgi:hypothetical protein